MFTLPLSRKIQSLPDYAFAENDRIVAESRQKGIDIIDFGTGDPKDPAPEFIRNAAKQALDDFADKGYPDYAGMLGFKAAVADWYLRRFGVLLDPETEVTSTIGSKEAIFGFPQAILNPGDFAIMPSPGYPPYSRGTIFVNGVPYFYPLKKENNFLPDFDAIPEGVAEKAKIFWICYPNSPTGATAGKKFFLSCIRYCQKRNIILASDECYVDIYFGKKTASALEIQTEGVVAFHSLSKRNNMTGYRVGFACGDSRIISAIRKLKTNIDSGTPNFIQAAAIAALSDESHAESMRQKYGRRREILQTTLEKCGFEKSGGQGTFYVWQKAPRGYTSVSFAKKLLLECGILVTPGEWISESAADGENPGRYYVRFALVEPEDRVSQACERIEKIIF